MPRGQRWPAIGSSDRPSRGSRVRGPRYPLRAPRRSARRPARGCRGGQPSGPSAARSAHICGFKVWCGSSVELEAIGRGAMEHPARQSPPSSRHRSRRPSAGRRRRRRAPHASAHPGTIGREPAQEGDLPAGRPMASAPGEGPPTWDRDLAPIGLDDAVDERLAGHDDHRGHDGCWPSTARDRGGRGLGTREMLHGAMSYDLLVIAKEGGAEGRASRRHRRDRWWRAADQRRIPGRGARAADRRR